MLALWILLAPVVILIIGFIYLGIKEDKDIWYSAWGNFKYKRKMKRRSKYE